MKYIQLVFLIVIFSCNSQTQNVQDEIFCTHNVVLDEHDKLIPWYTPREYAYDNFLHLRWDFIKTRVPYSPGPPPRSEYPQYYFYCAFRDSNNVLLPDSWMNDVGEKIPNWFESARLYYAYTGDTTVMHIAKGLIDYALENGTSSHDFAWPDFPYTTTNAGDTLFRGFTSAGRLALHEIQVDHAGEMGLTYFRMYQYSGEEKYLTAALNVADILAENARTGDGEQSVWPYRVVMDSGRITAPYGANWTGCYMLFDHLIKANKGKVEAYRDAREKTKEFILKYPMKTGYWTDGHTDTDVKSNTYKSNLSASNTALCLFDYPELDPDWMIDIPRLIKWTEDNFIFRTSPGEPATMWGANIVGEQDSFNYKMDYQTARYAAACARWYAASGDESYKEKAFRSLNWVTYCNDSAGMAFESPVSKGILSWWSDCYGECPRMFYHAFAGIPEWAPPREDHILYSEGIVNNVSYIENKVSYTSAIDNAVEYLRLSFKPVKIVVNGNEIFRDDSRETGTYALKKLGKGDYAVTVKHGKGKVVISGKSAQVSQASVKPEPAGWYTGDIHVHRNCGEATSITAESELPAMMDINDLDVIVLMADMGNGEVKDSKTDLPKVTGNDAVESKPGRIIHWEAEWHYDPAGVTFENKAIGGHLLFLGLTEANQIWNESPHKILEWGKKQNAVAGFCHMQYLNDKTDNELDCCAPLDFPVEAALGTIDFLSEDVWLNDASVNAYYRILNCGFRLGWTAGTDFPCNGGAPPGSLLTYVQIKDKPLTYRNWVEGIKNGRTVVATNGHIEFLDLKVNGDSSPGDEIVFNEKSGRIDIETVWNSVKELSGRIEIVCNGKIIATMDGTSGPGTPVILKTTANINESSWICARRMDDKGHQSHTSPVYLKIKDKPVRASAEDADYFVKWIDNILLKTAQGGSWSQYFTTDRDIIQKRYTDARNIYSKIADEARIN